jgi:hypothetical protein
MQSTPDSPSTYHEIIYNDGYGGYSFSQKALDEYCKRRNIQFETIRFREESLRDDPVMISVVKDLEKQANGKYAKLRIHRIPKRFAKAWSIGEYDGFEHVIVDFDKFKLDEIRNFLDNQGDSELKEKLLAILDEEYHY